MPSNEVPLISLLTVSLIDSPPAIAYGDIAFAHVSIRLAFADEVNAFKNGGAAEYRSAQKCVERMRSAKDVDTATYYMNELSENRFIGSMAKRAAKSSVVIADCLSKISAVTDGMADME